jgi:hypothetical protein
MPGPAPGILFFTLVITGLVPVIPIGRTQRFPAPDGRDKAGDDEAERS